MNHSSYPVKSPQPSLAPSPSHRRRSDVGHTKALGAGANEAEVMPCNWCSAPPFHHSTSHRVASVKLSENCRVICRTRWARTSSRVPKPRTRWLAGRVCFGEPEGLGRVESSVVPSLNLCNVQSGSLARPVNRHRSTRRWQHNVERPASSRGSVRARVPLEHTMRTYLVTRW